MIFKNDWEKTKNINNLSTDLIERMIEKILPTEKLLSQEIISGGCANINIKICLKKNKKTYILRIYMRDKDAALR